MPMRRLRRKDADLAIQNYNKALELKPDYADAYNNRGVGLREKTKLTLLSKTMIKR